VIRDSGLENSRDRDPFPARVVTDVCDRINESRIPNLESRI